MLESMTHYKPLYHWNQSPDMKIIVLHILRRFSSQAWCCRWTYSAEVLHWKESKCAHSGKMFVIYLYLPSYTPFGLVLMFWKICHLKCMTNPESNSEDGERLTCSQSAHFMGEELSAYHFILLSRALNILHNPWAPFQLTFSIYFLFYSGLPGPESFLS